MVGSLFLADRTHLLLNSLESLKIYDSFLKFLNHNYSLVHHMNSETKILPDLQTFKKLPHAVSLLGMSGVGKTVLSSGLRRHSNWFHFSADYRIGTAYLAEHIVDNIKYKIMNMKDPFVADLLRSDSIYISHNITVENLDPVSTFLGMFGDQKFRGLDKSTFIERQDLYRDGEISSMLDVMRFIDKAWRIYRCHNFINDASGSLCEVVDPDDENDEVLSSLTKDTVILYLRADDLYENKLLERAQSHPKPLYYHSDFITPRLSNMPDDGVGVNPIDFARPLFPELLDFRKPRYQKIADDFGFTMDVNDLFGDGFGNNTDIDSDVFMEKLYCTMERTIAASETGAENAIKYIQACENRLRRHEQV